MTLRELALKEILRVLWWYFAWSFMFWLFGYYALINIMGGKALELFRLGNLPVPAFIHASNIEVAITCAVACIALAVGFYLRYVKYGDEIQFKRMYGIKDDRSFSDEISDMSGGDGGGD